jgi:hypothetical protein
MDSSGKPQRRVWATGIMGFLLLLGLVCWIRRVPPAPTEYVGSMEANHPWMMFDPTMEQDYPSPFADKKDPNIVYLIFSQKNGLAVKIDLKTKVISQAHFTSDDGDPGTTIRYKIAVVTRLEYVSSDEPVFEEFRGMVEKRKISHMFGFPVATKPGTREATLRTGYWYVVDHRNAHKAELLRVKIKDSELTGNGGLGETYISPDKKWIVFRLANHPARIFIFNRESTDPETFQ